MIEAILFGVGWVLIGFLFHVFLIWRWGDEYYEPEEISKQKNRREEGSNAGYILLVLLPIPCIPIYIIARVCIVSVNSLTKISDTIFGKLNNKPDLEKK